jgi:Mn-dependent DtxR family transcriptional regulator
MDANGGLPPRQNEIASRIGHCNSTVSKGLADLQKRDRIVYDSNAQQRSIILFGSTLAQNTSANPENNPLSAAQPTFVDSTFGPKKLTRKQQTLLDAIERFITDNHGLRPMQFELASILDWSRATTSRALAELRDCGRIDYESYAKSRSITLTDPDLSGHNDTTHPLRGAAVRSFRSRRPTATAAPTTFMRQSVTGPRSFALPGPLATKGAFVFCATPRHGLYRIGGGTVVSFLRPRSSDFESRATGGAAVAANHETLAVGGFTSDIVVLIGTRTVALRGLAESAAAHARWPIDTPSINRVAPGGDDLLFAAVRGVRDQGAIAVFDSTGNVIRVIEAHRPLAFAAGPAEMYYTSREGVGKIGYADGHHRFVRFETAVFDLPEYEIPGEITAGPSGIAYFSTKFFGERSIQDRAVRVGSLFRAAFDDTVNFRCLKRSAGVMDLTYANGITWLARTADNTIDALLPDGKTLTRKLAPETRPRYVAPYGTGVVASLLGSKTVALVADLDELANGTTCRSWTLGSEDHFDAVS